jgi:phosphate transport system protein
MASDLRVVLTAWRIAGELERVGDLAKNIAKRALILNQVRTDPADAFSVERMGKIAGAHLKQVLDAYANKDVQAAINVWNNDDNIDAHYNSLFRELLTYMIEDPRTISSCAHLLFIAKNLERIGDHGTNIAEYIHFLVTGEEIATQRPRADASRRLGQIAMAKATHVLVVEDEEALRAAAQVQSREGRLSRLRRQ